MATAGKSRYASMVYGFMPARVNPRSRLSTLACDLAKFHDAGRWKGPTTVDFDAR
jgi:hypothetical protein